MSFMELTHKRAWHEIDGTAGIEWFDAEDSMLSARRALRLTVVALDQADCWINR